MRKTLAILSTLGAGALLLAGCTTAAPTEDEPASVSVAISIAPALNPLSTQDNSSHTLRSLGFATLVSLDPDSGAIRTGIASDWEESSTGVTFAIAEGVLCSDGSEITPSVVAKTFNWVLDADNGSPLLGSYVPRGATVAADDAAGTFTVSTPDPNSFTLSMVSRMPILCGAGADDPESLVTSFTGSGMYELEDFVEGQSYTYALRDDFAWGPNGVTAQDEGIPDEVVVEVVSNESTVANMLATGGVNIGQVAGSDRTRLDATDLYSKVVPARPGLLFFNQAEGRFGADLDARVALIKALDLAEVGAIGSAGFGVPLESITVAEPSVCVSKAATKGLTPDFDADAAAAGLDAARWVLNGQGVREKDGAPLSMKLLYPSTYGPAIGSATEAIQSELAEVGVTVELFPSDNYASVLFSGGDWDMVWAPLTISLPTDWQGIFTSPAAPEGQNFASVDNAAYAERVAEANVLTGADSCGAWEHAEEALLENIDVVPVVGNTAAFYGAGVTFDVTLGVVDGTSIRIQK